VYLLAAGEHCASVCTDPAALHVAEPPGAGGTRRSPEQQPDQSDVVGHQQG